MAQHVAERIRITGMDAARFSSPRDTGFDSDRLAAIDAFVKARYLDLTASLVGVPLRGVKVRECSFGEPPNATAALQDRTKLLSDRLAQ